MKKSIQLFLLFVVFGLSQQVANAQTISGNVSDTKGEPLIGATILEKGLGNGTTSDIDGKALYTSTCVACHGVDGKLGTNGSKDLTASALTLEERMAVLNNGVPGTAMVAYNTIYSPKEIQAIAEYTMELGK